MDRREALKKLASAGAVASAGVAVHANPAFADGGTASKRPSCASASVTVTPIRNGSGTNDWIQISFGSPTCPSGWTASNQVRLVSVSNTGGTEFVNAGASVVGTGSFTTASTVTINGTSGAPTSDLGDGTVAVSLVVRRVCTLGSRRAWCCRTFTRSGAWDGGDPSWGGTNGGSATGNTASCDSPAP